MATLFLFGAGASYGSGPCYPHNPPLGWDLFAQLRKRGGVAATVSDELAALFATDFEQGMDVFWKERNADTSALLREMAVFFSQFQPLPGNLYFQLIAILGGTRKKTVIATTNYDLLIEYVISASGLQIAYMTPAPMNDVSVLKIHGSCNFLPPPEIVIKGLGFVTQPESKAILSAPVSIAKSAREIMDYCEGGTSLAPALAMYHSSKRVLYCPDFVSKQQDEFVAAVSSAKRIFVVGLRVHPIDAHIWLPLARSTAPLYYVGRESELKTWADDVKRQKAFWLGETFAGSINKIASLVP